MKVIMSPKTTSTSSMNSLIDMSYWLHHLFTQLLLPDISVWLCPSWYYLALLCTNFNPSMNVFHFNPPDSSYCSQHSSPAMNCTCIYLSRQLRQYFDEQITYNFEFSLLYIYYCVLSGYRESYEIDLLFSECLNYV